MLRRISSFPAIRARPSATGAFLAPALSHRSLVSSILLSSTRDVYENKRLPELRQELKARGLSSNGKKSDLINRLVESDSVQAGSNAHQQSSNATRTKSTLASLRAKESTKVSEEENKVPKKAFEAVAKTGSPPGFLKKTDTPASLEAGTVHNAAADGLDPAQVAKASPKILPKDSSITNSPPGLPPQKAPQPTETFKIHIPSYSYVEKVETYIPIVTSYTSPKVKTQGQQAQGNISSGPKVISISGEGVSHNADFNSAEADAPSAEKGFLQEVLSSIPGAHAITQNIPGSKVLRSLREQASTVINQATAQLVDSVGPSSSFADSSSGSGSVSGSVRSANRPLTNEERTGAWVLLGIVAGGFALGGLGKSKSKEVATHESKPETVAVKATLAAQPTDSSVAIPSGSESVKVPITFVPKGPTVTSAPAAAATGLSDSTLAQIARLSTCEVSDALIKLKLPHGGHLPGIQVFSPQHLDGDTKICGPAFTVKMVSQKDTDAPKPEKHFVDAAPAHSVMVVTAPSTNRSAVWGGLMTARAQFLGVQGVILDGRCRDLSEHRQAKFPVFARGHSTLGQSPFTRPSELQVPITIVDPTLAWDRDSAKANGSKFPSLTVNPGDIVLADLDGVVVIPPSLAEQVIAIANKSRAEDANCLEDLKRGKGVKETFAKHRSK